MIKQVEMGRAGCIVWVCSHSVLVREAGSNITGRDRVRRERFEDSAIGSEVRGRSPEPRNSGGLWLMEEAKTHSPFFTEGMQPRPQNCEILSSLL